jgi:hypothetical protein
LFLGSVAEVAIPLVGPDLVPVVVPVEQRNESKVSEPQ